MAKKNPYTNQKSPDVTFLNDLTSGLVKIIAASDLWERLTDKARSDKTPLPKHLIGLRKIAMYICSIGHNYEDILNNRLDKSGLNCVHGDFKSDETYAVSHPDSTNGILLVHKEDIKLSEDNSEKRNYVRTYILGHEPKVISEGHYINASNEIIIPTQKEIDEYFPKVYDSKKQAGFWLEGNAQVKPKNYKSHNILYLQRGDKVYNNLLKSMMDLFDLEYVK